MIMKELYFDKFNNKVVLEVDMVSRNKKVLKWKKNVLYTRLISLRVFFHLSIIANEFPHTST